MNRWAARYGYKNSPKAILEDAKKGCNGSICDMALTYTDSEISKISWTDFVSILDEETCSELITYLKERQLYINAPITTEEDD